MKKQLGIAGILMGLLFLSAELYGLKAPYLLHIGQVLVIPAV